MTQLSIMETFITNLRNALKAEGLRQKDLCARTGILPPNLSRLLTRAENMTVSIASDLANAVGYPLHRLLDPDFQPKKHKRKDIAA